MGLFTSKENEVSSLMNGYGKIFTLCEGTKLLYIVRLYLEEKNGKGEKKLGVTGKLNSIIVASMEVYCSNLLVREAQMTALDANFWMHNKIHTEVMLSPDCSEPMTKHHSGSSAIFSNR